MTHVTSAPDLAIFTPTLEGGVGTVLTNLTEGLAGLGVRVEIVTLTQDQKPEAPRGVSLVCLPSRRVATALLPLVRYLRRTKPRTVLSAVYHANVLAVLAYFISRVSSRLVVSEHIAITQSLGAESKWKRFFLQRGIRFFYSLADAVVAVSKGAADELAAIGIPKNKLAVVYNPVLYPEMLQSAQVPPTHPWFLHHTEAIILGVGRLAPQKDFHTLLDAFALVRRQTAAKLLLLGEGPERGALADMISQLGLEDSVQLLGQVQNPLSYMRHADLFVLSSRFEGLPTVLIEALAVGVPIVSTDCPSGPREILQNGALGVLVPVADPEALAQAIVIELTKERGLPADATPQLEKYTRDYAVSAYRLILQI